MRPAEARRLAQAYDLAALEAAAAQLANEADPPIEIRGADHGEQLTHVLLAIRIRAKLDAGIDLHAAYRAVMADVRRVLSNDSKY